MKHKIVSRYRIISVFIGIILIASCERAEDENGRFPRTNDEIKESIIESQGIGKQSAIVVENAIADAFSKGIKVDVNEVAKSIQLINGVQSAVPTPSRAGITIQQNDSTWINVLIGRMDDNRLFSESPKKSPGNSSKASTGIKIDYFKPNGGGKALILSPFQSDVEVDLDKLNCLLESAGYNAEAYINEAADLDRFRGSFLNDYDIVFIITHGMADGETWAGTYKSTMLLTGEKLDPDKWVSLPQEERDRLGCYSLASNDDQLYLAISAPWLELTTDASFTNTWVFACAGESAKVEKGPTSISDTFLKLGAGGYNGFYTVIWGPAAVKTLEKTTEIFTSGLSFIDTYTKVIYDPELNAQSWTIMIENPMLEEFPLFELFYPGLIFFLYDKSEFFYLIDEPEKHIMFNPDLTYGSVTDIDGNTYKTLQIGTQIWLAENLKTTTFNDGTPIPNPVGQEWLVDPSTMNFRMIPAYCWYNMDIYNKDIYGALYNWHTVNTGKLCPEGWHVPTVNEYELLFDYLGGLDFDTGAQWKTGAKLKEIGRTHWLTYNGTNESGFTSLPGGVRFFEGTCRFANMHEMNYMWTQDIYNYSYAWFVSIHDSPSSVHISPSLAQGCGCSIRCIMD